MKKTFEFPISYETYQRYVSYHRKYPEHSKPFGFEVLGSDCYFVINHATEDGYLWLNDKKVTIEEFYNFISSHSKRMKGNEIVLLCCHGGNIKNKNNKIHILNESRNVLEINPPELSSSLDGDYFIVASYED